MRLAGKIAIITGGASGIGHEASKLFAANGAVVMVADRDLEGATRVVQEIKAQGGKASAYQVDVAQEAEVKAMVEATVAAHGRLDILVNNAGYGFAGTVVTTSEADWDALMAVNVKGVFFGCKYAIPAMEKQGGGAIVNTASGAARVGIVVCSGLSRSGAHTQAAAHGTQPRASARCHLPAPACCERLRGPRR